MDHVQLYNSLLFTIHSFYHRHVCFCYDSQLENSGRHPVHTLYGDFKYGKSMGIESSWPAERSIVMAIYVCLCWRTSIHHYRTFQVRQSRTSLFKDQSIQKNKTANSFRRWIIQNRMSNEIHTNCLEQLFMGVSILA